MVLYSNYSMLLPCIEVEYCALINSLNQCTLYSNVYCVYYEIMKYSVAHTSACSLIFMHYSL